MPFVGNSGGGGGASSLGDLSDIGTMGEPIAQADNITETITAMGGASAVRAAIDASQDSIAVEDMTGTGWTTLAGSGTHTETWDGSELAMTVDVSGAGSGAVRHTTLLPSPLSWSLAARVAIVTGNGGSQRQAYIAAGVDATNNVALALFGDGTLIASSTVGGSYGAHATVSTTVPSGDRTGGQLWLLIEKYGGTLTYAWGVGSAGARPTAWTIIHINTTTTVVSAASGLLAQIGTVTDTGIAWAVDVRAIHSGRAGVL